MFSITTSYTDARKNLATLFDRVEQENAIALITRRGHQDIAILPAEELISLTEAYIYCDRLVMLNDFFNAS